MKVLILHPDPRIVGGIQLYYQKLNGRFNMPVDHFIIGKRPDEKTLFKKISRIISDYGRFIIMLRKEKHDIIHVNPALDFNMFLRDGIFHLFAKLGKRKTIVFFRGWRKSFELKVQRHGLWLFKLLYYKANIFIVLSEEFKKVLLSWDCTKPIFREVTVIDDNVLKGFDVYKTNNERIKSDRWRILFLSRIVREKGVYETIEATEILRKKYPEIELIIAGEGEELERVKKIVRERCIDYIIFPGFVKDEEKTNLMKRSHILCLPTYYSEGLPNSITESMAFGLPIVTRPVGGITDFFKNGEHGFVTNSRKPTEYANLIEKLFVDRRLYSKISFNNYQYAKTNFLASQAALRLEKIYKGLLDPNLA